MKVYCAVSVRGNRDAIELGRAVVGALRAAGHEILTEHLFKADPGDEQLSAKDVFGRDMAWLGSADALVADVSGSSYGVGFEVGYTLALGNVPVVLYCSESREPFVSKMALGSTTGVVVCDAARPDEAAARVMAEFDSRFDS